MPIEIALVDRTKIRHDDTVSNFVATVPAEAGGWVYLNEGDGTPKRHFNVANMLYVVEVESPPDGPLIAHI